MTDQGNAGGPRVPFLGIYLKILVVSIIGLVVLRYALAILIGIGLPLGGLVILPPMIAALVAGQHWGRERGVVPANAEAWRFAWQAGLFWLALLLLMAPLALSVGPPETAFLATVAGGIVVTAGVGMVINRIFLVIGAKGAVAAPKGR